MLYDNSLHTTTLWNVAKILFITEFYLLMHAWVWLSFCTFLPAASTSYLLFKAFLQHLERTNFCAVSIPVPPRLLLCQWMLLDPPEKCSKLLYYRHILKRNPKVPKPLFLLANSILISFQKHCELKVQAFSENPVVGALLVVKLLQQLFRSLRAL